MSSIQNFNESNYAIAYIDLPGGDRRINLHIREEDTELALEVMRSMATQGPQGQTPGVQPTKRKFDQRELTTRKALIGMLDVAEALREYNVNNPF
tara:strand:+ start:196 stop:480 length:285 start_codon:yes stop_codon:yes gene_type:complete